MTLNKKDPTWQIHDKFFKGMFIYWAVIRSFIEQYILPKIQVKIDWDTIISIRTESVDHKFRVLFSDMIFEVKSESGVPLYLLLEHISQADDGINKKLVKYIDTFELDYLNDHKDAIAPLNMIPILVYHGLEKWTVTERKGRLENLMFFDLSSMPAEQIKGSAALRIVLLTLKYIKSEEIVTKIDDILEIFNEIKDASNSSEYVQLFTWYVEHASKKGLKEMLVQKMQKFFSDEKLEKSTVVKALEARGEKIGEARGEKTGIDIGANKGAQAAKLILTTKKDDEEISKETGLAIEKIRELRTLLTKD